MQDHRAKLSWRDQVIPVSDQFDDPYFSIHNGLEETQHVFLDGNGLPDRFRGGFHIAELGFGTGLNALTAWAAWDQAGHKGPLRFTSFEAYPMETKDMARALAAFPDLADRAERFLTAWDGATADLGSLHLQVITGDARDTVPKWDQCADAWFLDGFSPAKNPELWDAELMKAVADHTAPNGTFATYTAAGFVRRALKAAGFAVQRSPGYGRKRHMSQGVLV